MMDWRQRKAIEAKNKERIKAICPSITENSGIYVFYRLDENGIKHAYVGQAQHLLTRCAEHLAGYTQHIDLSIRKWKLWSIDNPTGWRLTATEFPPEQLDKAEQENIKCFAESGHQLKNVNLGGQGSARISGQIGQQKPPKGYRDGIAQGRKNLARELSAIADKHLEIRVKPEKAGNKVSEKQFEKFNFLLRNESEVEDGR